MSAPAPQTQAAAPVIKRPGNSFVFREGVGDPGKNRSHFAVLAADILPHPANEIRIFGGKEWGKDMGNLDYVKIEMDLLQMHAKLNFNEFAIEKNNTGDHVIDNLRYLAERNKMRPLPIYPIITTGTAPTNPEDRPDLMWKEGAADYAKFLKDSGVIKIPEQKTPVLRKLEEQMSNFLPHYGKTGARKYYAEGDERDDLVMCLLMLCHRAKHLLSGNLQPRLKSGGFDSAYWDNLKNANLTKDERILRQPRIQERLKNLGVKPKDVKVL